MERRYHATDILGPHAWTLSLRADGRVCIKDTRWAGGPLLHRSYWRAVAGQLDAWPLLGQNPGNTFTSVEAPDERLVLSGQHITTGASVGSDARTEEGCMIFGPGSDRDRRNVLLPPVILWAVAQDLRGLADGTPLPTAPSVGGRRAPDLSGILFGTRS